MFGIQLSLYNSANHETWHEQLDMFLLSRVGRHPAPMEGTGRMIGGVPMMNYGELSIPPSVS